MRSTIAVFTTAYGWVLRQANFFAAAWSPVGPSVGGPAFCREFNKAFYKEPDKAFCKEPDKAFCKESSKAFCEELNKAFCKEPSKVCCKELRETFRDELKVAPDGFSPRNGSRVIVEPETVSVKLPESPRNGS
eukprot:5174162-Pyramimonas_sp.AAC.1